VTSVASLYKYRCRVKCWYELTRRGFLTPPDCLVIIWCQLLLHISVLLVTLQRNPQDFKVPINSFSVRPPTLLTALCQCPKTNYKGLTDKGIDLSLLNRQLNRVWTLLFLREICLHTTLKPVGWLLSVNASLQSLKSIRRYFTWCLTFGHPPLGMTLDGCVPNILFSFEYKYIILTF
jgi:hypothetical protein